MTIRTYKDQFEAEDIEKIESIFSLLDKLKDNKNVLRFYCQELRCALTGGSILAGLLISFSIMEMFVLDNYVSKHFDEHDEKYSKAICELEQKKKHVNELLNESVNMGFIEKEDAEKLIKLYKEWRIPLGHGLRTKGLYHSIPIWNIFFGLKDNHLTPVSWKEMEANIHEDGLDIIAEILKILSK